MSKIGNVGGSFSGSVQGPDSVKGTRRKPGNNSPALETEKFSEEQRDKARDYSNSAGHDETYTNSGDMKHDTNYGTIDLDA